MKDFDVDNYLEELIVAIDDLGGRVWSSEESAAGDGSRPLTELADRHSPLEVLFEKIVDPSRSAEPAIPIDDKNDKSEYRPEGDQAPNDCRNPIHGLFASGAPPIAPISATTAPFACSTAASRSFSAVYELLFEPFLSSLKRELTPR